MRHGLCLLIALALCGQICAENLLVNPSFENPAVTACTPNSQHPTSWQWTTTSWEWNSCSVLNGFLYNTSHNGPLPFYPTCSAFGDNYNTMSEWRSNQAVRDGYVYQTVSVTPGQTYLFSGQFAGMGSVGAEIYLQDGGYNSTKLNTATVRSDAAMDVEPGWSDWQFESVSATPTSAGGGQMTVVWHAHNISSVAPYENRAVFADALSLEACTVWWAASTTACWRASN
jgi:hypothetical protein